LRISQDENSIIGILKKTSVFVFGDSDLLVLLFGKGLNDISIEGSHNKHERDAKNIAAHLFRGQKPPGIEEDSIEKCGHPSNDHQ